MSKIKKYVILIMSIVVLVCFFNLVVIFEGSNDSIDKIYRLVKNSSANKNVMLLKYEYSTGVGWFVIDSNNTELKGKNIVLSTPFNPRLLKMNRDYYLDYTAKFVVVVDRYSETKIDGEILTTVHPQKIVIQHKKAKEKYYLKDMQLMGSIRFLLGVVFRNLWNYK